MLALNRKEIQNKILKFCLWFGVLIFAMLLVVYFFVWASVMEKKKYIEKIQECKQIENEQIVLSYKMDSLYWYIGKLSPISNTDEKFLVSYIRDQKQNINNLSQKDSNDNFAIYTSMMDRLDDQLEIRDSIIAVESNNGDIKRSLDECMAKSLGIKKSLNNGSQVLP